MHTYLKGITNIDDERISGGFDGEPGAMAMADLQATHWALVQNGEKIGVGVSTQSECEGRQWAWWIVVEASNAVSCSTQVRLCECGAFQP